MQKHVVFGVFRVLGLALGLASAWAGAQTAEPDKALPAAPSGKGSKAGEPGKPGDADQTVPLKNPLNRNPARRQQKPEKAAPAPDPRDSTTRPVIPPGNDGRDAVPPADDMAQAPSR